MEDVEDYTKSAVEELIEIIREDMPKNIVIKDIVGTTDMKAQNVTRVELHKFTFSLDVLER